MVGLFHVNYYVTHITTEHRDNNLLKLCSGLQDYKHITL